MTISQFLSKKNKFYWDKWWRKKHQKVTEKTLKLKEEIDAIYLSNIQINKRCESLLE